MTESNVMNVNLSGWHDETECTWCEKNKECVTADFGDGFIQKAALCWSCLTKAVRVRARQASTSTNRSKTEQ